MTFVIRMLTLRMSMDSPEASAGIVVWSNSHNGGGQDEKQ